MTLGGLTGNDIVQLTLVGAAGMVLLAVVYGLGRLAGAREACLECAVLRREVDALWTSLRTGMRAAYHRGYAQCQDDVDQFVRATRSAGQAPSTRRAALEGVTGADLVTEAQRVMRAAREGWRR